MALRHRFATREQRNGRGTSRWAQDGLSNASVTGRDELTLALHGDVSLSSVPQLQAILDGVLLLRPRCLVIDLSDVGSVSREALRMMQACSTRVDQLVLSSSPPAGRTPSGGPARDASTEQAPVQLIGLAESP